MFVSENDTITWDAGYAMNSVGSQCPTASTAPVHSVKGLLPTTEERFLFSPFEVSTTFGILAPTCNGCGECSFMVFGEASCLKRLQFILKHFNRTIKLLHECSSCKRKCLLWYKHFGTDEAFILKKTKVAYSPRIEKKNKNLWTCT